MGPLRDNEWANAREHPGASWAVVANSSQMEVSNII